ncbi:MAG TPA: hypothetical protein VFY83_10150 [Anaerolineales bacterium]|jgi:hypothetical protein|nr:hypothetical protein [Anaerolineales bacterium]
MAEVKPKNGRYGLGGSKDTDLEGIDDQKYEVFTDTAETNDKLKQARDTYPDYTWFASFTIKDKQGKDVRTLDKEYTVELDQLPSEDSELYYFLDGRAHKFPHQPGADKNSKKRIKAKLSVGDPPIGTYP